MPTFQPHPKIEPGEIVFGPPFVAKLTDEERKQLREAFEESYRGVAAQVTDREYDEGPRENYASIRINEQVFKDQLPESWRDRPSLL